MQPYVVKQGEYLALIAYQSGFDAETVWNDPSNAALRAQRPDPNLLSPGDVLSVPSPPVAPTGTALESGQTNTFTVSPPTVSVTLKFVDAELASQPVTIFELPDVTGLVTGAEGSLVLTVPITQQTCTVVFTNDGTTFTCNVGAMNPLGTVSGIAQRLQNLGYLDPHRFYGANDLDTIRAALRAFRADQPAPSTPPPSSPGPESAPASQPPTSSPPPSSGDTGGPPSSSSAPRELGLPEPAASDPSPPSAAPSSAPSSQPPAPELPVSEAAPASTPPASEPPASTPPASTPPPSSGSSPPSSPPSSQGATVPDDNAGLADDGTLDPAVAQFLLAAHGS